MERGNMEQTKHRKKKHLWLIPVLIIAALFACFFFYVENFYRADATALAALESDETVTVTQTDFGWLFDGPSEKDALIFYPGGKVEETAYAPLLHLFAEQGTDVLLVKMPFRLAVFGGNKAGELISRYDYSDWSIGGHSLGGAMAANYAAKHPDPFKSILLLAAYATKDIDDSLFVLSVYGSEDGVLNMENLEKGNAYLPEDSAIVLMEGGNHAQFGNYGEQKGDGKATITAEEQQEQTVKLFIQSKQ